MIEIDIMGHRCICSKDSIKIIDSYQIPNEKVELFLTKLKLEINDKIIYKRSLESWKQQWVCYNIMYDLNIYRDITKDVILNEDITEQKSNSYCALYNLFQHVEYIQNKKK